MLRKFGQNGLVNCQGHDETALQFIV